MKKLIVCLSLCLATVQFYAQKEIGDNCGTWRWDIKTATDEQGESIISMKPMSTTIDKLTSIERPEKVGKTDPRFPEETKLVKVRGYIIEHKIVGGSKGDTDYHIVVLSSTKKTQLIAEIPNPECGVFSSEPTLKELFSETRESYNEDFGTPTTRLKELPEPIEVEIVGIPMWDMPDHGGGCSPNGIEIHPVISIKRLSPKNEKSSEMLFSVNESNNNDNNKNTMESSIPVSPTDLLSIILLGVILGMVGQGLRVIVGLKKVNDTANKENKSFNEVFDKKAILISLMYAFAIGAIGGVIMAIDYIGKPIDKTAILAMIAAAYAGTDFIEGFVNKNLKKQ